MSKIQEIHIYIYVYLMASIEPSIFQRHLIIQTKTRHLMHTKSVTRKSCICFFLFFWVLQEMLRKMLIMMRGIREYWNNTLIDVTFELMNKMIKVDLMLHIWRRLFKAAEFLKIFSVFTIHFTLNYLYQNNACRQILYNSTWKFPLS